MPGNDKIIIDMEPIIRKMMPFMDENFDEDFKEKFSSDDLHKTNILVKYPTVYIHNWQEKGSYEVYVGETNDIYQRTKQHMNDANDPNNWQYRAKKNNDVMFVIGHDHFNKSLTLDIENRLMDYTTCIPGVNSVNGRGNPQNDYYSRDELDSIFSQIWRKLRQENKELFIPESQIKESAIFKASPFKKLTDEQKYAQDVIIQKVIEAYQSNDEHSLVFIDGEAGTGKTVLNSSTFYELYCQNKDKDSELYKYTQGNFRSYLVVNHEQQITVYKQITKKLGISNKEEVVYTPTKFLNMLKKDEKVDIVFIDEGHLLLTQHTQEYSNKAGYAGNQLEEIMKHARITVIMFDEKQVLKGKQYWDIDTLNRFRDIAKNSQTYVTLNKQMRMQVDEQTKDWIDSFTNENTLKDIPHSSKYEIKVFDSPKDLDEAINNKYKHENTRLSRLVATYDWDYNASKVKEDGKPWEVVIDDWHKPWNYEIKRHMDKDDKKDLNDLVWAEQLQTIDEVGSTFSIQGFDLNYVGVILGPSVKYRNGKIVFDPSQTSNKQVRKRKISDSETIDCREDLLKHEVRVLMTRGVDGLYIYACDKELREALLKAQGNNHE